MKNTTERKPISNENISVSLFRQKWLDSLTRAPFWVPITFLVLFTTGLLTWSVTRTDTPVGLSVVLFFVGWLLFTFTEYMMHRFLYHLSTPTEKRKVIQYKIHGVHHQYPKDRLRLAMPPFFMMCMATIFLSLFYLILNTFAFITLSGFTTGYMLYLFVHYSVHVYSPPRNFMKALWVNHAIHHYSQEKFCFGVSSPLWDHVFGTYPKKKTLKAMSVESITALNL